MKKTILTACLAVVAGLTLQAQEQLPEVSTRKTIEVKKADVESQREQMDLASDYLAKVKELSELNYQATLKNGTDNGQIIEEIKKLSERVGDIEGCLNGKLANYKKEKHEHEQQD
jgi:hypothetical protein